jgi:hypothetical protein
MRHSTFHNANKACIKHHLRIRFFFTASKKKKKKSNTSLQVNGNWWHIQHEIAKTLHLFRRSESCDRSKRISNHGIGWDQLRIILGRQWAHVNSCNEFVPSDFE